MHQSRIFCATSKFASITGELAEALKKDLPGGGYLVRARLSREVGALGPLGKVIAKVMEGFFFY